MIVDETILREKSHGLMVKVNYITSVWAPATALIEWVF